MDIMNVHCLYIIVIILILIKSFMYFKKKEIKEVKKPTLEYYEWKRIFYKMIVLKKLYKKRNHTNKILIE